MTQGRADLGAWIPVAQVEREPSEVEREQSSEDASFWAIVFARFLLHYRIVFVIRFFFFAIRFGSTYGKMCP